MAIHAWTRARRNRGKPDRIHWRLGSFGALRAQMLAQLPTSRVGDAPAWLAQINAAVDGRFAYALTDAWALVAEILVENVQEIVDGSGISEVFLGLTVIALVSEFVFFKF